MNTWLLRRLLVLPLVLWVIYTLSFALVEMAPGDPVLGRRDRKPPQVVIQRLERMYNYDMPVWKRYGVWLGQYVTGDLGRSTSYGGQPVAELVGPAFARSAALGLLALSVAVLVGTAAGIVAATHQNQWIDQASLVPVLLGISLPSFVTAAVLQILFAVLLLPQGLGGPLFALGGWPDSGGAALRHLTLPAIALALPIVAYVSRLMRASMIETLRMDFVRTARAKGASPRRVVFRHALRNAFLPVLSFLGPAAAAVMTGSFVVEQVFRLPGMGDFFVKAVLDRDRRMVLSIVLVYAALLVTFNALTDLLYGVLDPRIRVRETADKVTT
jgi:oligopeptide transport system permease protein